ncbi:hypothetical protein [Dactylosporangium sp. NPDC050588]|uniref:hypothetical protein n=1 Tax=Dactylosporangium sp. NPDC050588 TaxID=3157211 RepID=UPI0034109EC1
MTARTAAVAVVASVVVLLAGCAGPDFRRGGPPPFVVGTDGPDRGALARWSDFPAGRRPRPVVLLGDPASAGAGFTDGAAKQAFAAKRLRVTATLPAGPATATVALPDGPAELGVIGAAAAVAALARPLAGSADPVLVLDQVRYAPATFPTDRGPLVLPAWQFSGPGVLGAIAWPAVDPAALWRPGENPDAGTTAVIAGDDRTLTVALPTPAGGACPGRPVVAFTAFTAFTAEAVATPAAVAVGLRAAGTGSVVPGPTRDDCASDDVLRYAQHTLVLDAPLGGRVVLGPDGAVIAVRRA